MVPNDHQFSTQNFATVTNNGYNWQILFGPCVFNENEFNCIANVENQTNSLNPNA